MLTKPSIKAHIDDLTIRFLKDLHKDLTLLKLGIPRAKQTDIPKVKAELEKRIAKLGGTL